MKRPHYKYFKRTKDLYRSWLNGILRRKQLAMHTIRVQQTEAKAGPVLNLLDKYFLQRGLKTAGDIIQEQEKNAR